MSAISRLFGAVGIFGRKGGSLCLPACLLAVTVAGCTSMPAEFAATLPTNDPKWRSRECQELRREAATYKERRLSYATGALIGPYGLAIVAASREHQEKQRQLFARDLHVACSSQPLPSSLQIDPSIKRSIFRG